MRSPTPTRAGRIVRTEVRRRWRTLADAGWRLALLLLAAVFFLLPVGGVVVAAYLLGSGAFGSGTTLRAASAAVAFVVAMETAAVGLRVVQGNGTPDAPEAVLLAAPTRDVVLGLLVTEALVLGGPTLVVGVLVSGAFALGAGAPLVLLLGPVALGGAAVAGASLGFALGLAVRLAIARSELLARYKTAVGFALLLAYFAVVTGGVDLPWLGALAGAADRPPLVWLGSLVTVGSLPAAGALDALAGAVLLATVAAGGYLASTALADRLWFEPKATPEGPTGERSAMTGGLADRLTGGRSGGAGGPLPRPVVRVVERSWLRARRAPITLSYVVYPVFFAISPLSTAVRTGYVPGWLPATLALYGAWATAAAFTLNPLGDEGPVFPVTLTSGVSGRAFVLGRCLAGALVGVPLTVAIVAATAVVADLPAVTAAALVANALVLTLGATGIGAGVGVALPCFDAVRVSRSREAVVPSLLAFGVFSLLLALVALPALLGGTPAATRGLGSLLGVDAAVLSVTGVSVTAALSLGLGGLGFRYAAGEFDGFHFDEG